MTPPLAHSPAGFCPKHRAFLFEVNMTESVEQERDASRWRWLVKNAALGFEGAPSYDAVIRLPVFSHDDQFITELVDRAMKEGI